MSKAEADKAVKQYTEILQKATQEWQEVKQKTLGAADKATDAAARSALISFFAILIAAALCSWAGAYGSKMTQRKIDM